MARTGRFGRLPRAAPDLTSTIVAMVREYQQLVDGNMVDAWKNGGEVDGKPVTDSRLLAHFKTRRDDLSKSDPMYQQWNNRIDQYQFSIEESKMQVKWDNGQASEGQMAAFYRRWEQKTPDNTEFDRTLRSAEGKWKSSASARGRASSARAKGNAYTSKQNTIYNNGPKQAEQANGILVLAGQALGILPAGDTVSMTDTFASQGDVQRMIDAFSDGKVNNDPTGAYAGVMAWAGQELKKIDPKFDWSSAWFNQTFDKGRTGVRTLLANASNGGTKAEVNRWSNALVNIGAADNRLSNMNAMKDALDNREWLRTQLDNANNDPGKEAEIWDGYLAKQTKIYRSQTTRENPGDPGYDAAFWGALGNEIGTINAAKAGQQVTSPPPTWLDNSTGTKAETGSDAQQLWATISTSYKNQALINAGGWARLVPDPQDSTRMIYQIHDPAEARQVGEVLLPGALRSSSGGQVPTYTTPAPVDMAAVDSSGHVLQQLAAQYNPVTHEPLMDDKGQPVTALNPVTQSVTGVEIISYPDPVSGKLVQGYRVQNPQTGEWVFRNDIPVVPASGAKVDLRSNGKGGWVLQVTQPPFAAPGGPGTAGPGRTAQAQAAPGGLAGAVKERDAAQAELNRVKTIAASLPSFGGGKPPGVKAAEDRLSRANAVVDNLKNPTGDEATRLRSAFTLASARYGPSSPQAQQALDSLTRTGAGYLLPAAQRAGVAEPTTATGPSAGGIGAAPTTFDPNAYVDRSQVRRDPSTGLYFGGNLESFTALKYSRWLEELDPKDPGYNDKLRNVATQLQGEKVSLVAMQNDLLKRGDQVGASLIGDEINRYGHDETQLRTSFSAALAGEVPGASMSHIYGVTAATGNRTPSIGEMQDQAKAQRLAGLDATDQGFGLPAAQRAGGFSGPFTGQGLPAAQRAAGQFDPRQLKLPGILDAIPFAQPFQAFLNQLPGMPQLAAPGQEPGGLFNQLLPGAPPPPTGAAPSPSALRTAGGREVVIPGTVPAAPKINIGPPAAGGITPPDLGAGGPLYPPPPKPTQPPPTIGTAPGGVTPPIYAPYAPTPPPKPKPYKPPGNAPKAS